MNTPLSSLLPLLRERPDIWRATTAVPQPQGLATGRAELDAQLHQRGWPRGALTELLCDHPGNGELQLLMPVLARLSQQGRKLVFIAPPHLPYAPALHRQGVDLAQVLLIRAPAVAEQVWAASQALRADSAGALLLWPGAGISHPQLRKLQLAAHHSSGVAVVFRPLAAAAEASPAALRITLSATAGTCELQILKQRGGWAGQRLSIPRTEGSAGMSVQALPVHVPRARSSCPGGLPDQPRRRLVPAPLAAATATRTTTATAASSTAAAPLQTGVGIGRDGAAQVAAHPALALRQ